LINHLNAVHTQIIFTSRSLFLNQLSDGPIHLQQKKNVVELTDCAAKTDLVPVECH